MERIVTHFMDTAVHGGELDRGPSRHGVSKLVQRLIFIESLPAGSYLLIHQRC